MKYNFKESILILLVSIINFLIAYSITMPLGICNIVLYKSFSAIGYIITYEVIIWFALSFVESGIYEYIFKKEQYI